MDPGSGERGLPPGALLAGLASAPCQKQLTAISYQLNTVSPWRVSATSFPLRSRQAYSPGLKPVLLLLAICGGLKPPPPSGTAYRLAPQINHLRRARALSPRSFDTLEIRTLLTAFRIILRMRAFLGRSTSLRVERP